MNTKENFTGKIFKFIKLSILILITLFPLIKLEAVEFKYIYNTGDKYRILSNVEEDVYLNRNFVQKAEIVNRISVEVTALQGESGKHKMISVTSEKTNPVSGITGNKGIYTWGEEYESIFIRDPQGVYTISDEYFMPVVRDIPVFPKEDITPGSTWSYKGHEAHDFRRGFGIEKPYKIPFNAEYKYIGPEVIDGKELHKILVEYTLEYTSPAPDEIDLLQLSDFPLLTRGYSTQTIYWDQNNGMSAFYNENFRIQIELFSGNTLEYIGTANAKVIETTLQRSQAEKEIKEKITKLGLENTTVKSDDKGVTITLENIQFNPDSSDLLPSEKEKLKNLITVLSGYKDNELLITGHTALAGTKEERDKLSLERASVVASFISENGEWEEKRIFTRGLGAEVPVGDNKTEEGKRKNRRVEITILEN